MAKIIPQEPSIFNNILNSQIDALISENEKEVDVITFVESPYYLNQPLHGVEKFILKVFYGIPLDDTIPYIHIRFFPYDEEGKMMTEVEYALYLQEQKRINILDLNFNASQHLLLVCGRRGGKCGRYDSYLFTDQGMVKIGDLAKNEAPDQTSKLTLNIVQEKGKKSNSDLFYNGGVKKVKNIKTNFGYEMGATFNHRIKVMLPTGYIDWKYMEDVTVGDIVCMNRKNDIWPDKPYLINFDWDVTKVHEKIKQPSNELDEKMAILLGLLVGDGTWTIDTGLQLTVGHHQEKDLIPYVENLFDDVIGYHSTQFQRNNNVSIQIHSKEYRRFFDHIGYTIKPEKRTKEIPWIILKERKNIVAKFLSGLYEADGCVESKRKITFSSDSKEMVNQIQLLLLNFGIISSRKVKYNKKYDRDYYLLYIAGHRNMKLFRDEIGFISNYNKDRLNAYFDTITPGYNGNDNQDKIPFQQKRMQEFWKENPTSRKNRGLIRHAAHGDYDLSYSKLDKILVEFNVDKDHYFQYIKECDYFFDEVVDNSVSEEQVYDLHIPDGNMYTANGFMSHNTFIASMICCYESYKLISKGNPQVHYGLPKGQKIKIITVATNAEQARIASDMIKNSLLQSPWLAKYCVSHKSNTIRMQTKYEFENKLQPTISIEAMPCTTAGIRGHTVIVAILDELAHFADVGAHRSGDQVYYSLTPSIATFGADGKILALSNPYTKSGIFYTLYLKAMGNGIELPMQHIRAFKLPSWEMNDTLSFQFFKNEYGLNPESFDYEYGAEFSGVVTGFFKFPEKIDDCINYSLIDKIRPSSQKTIHWVAMDPASVGNGYALCMVHTEERKTELGIKKFVVVDRWLRWLATDDEFQELGLNMIDPAVVDEYILDLATHFKIVKVRYDQYESAASVSKLVKKGLVAERVPITGKINMDIYKNLRNLIYNNEIELMDNPHGILELKYLQEKKLPSGRFTVNAPASGEVSTDDLADVLAVASYMAMEGDILGKATTMMGVKTSGSLVLSANKKNMPSSMAKYQKQQAMQNMRLKLTQGYRSAGMR